MSFQINNTDLIHMGGDTPDKIYMGLDLVWAPSADRPGTPWGPEEIFYLAGVAWGTSPQMESGDVLFDDFGMVTIAADLTTGLVTCTFTSSDNATGFLAEVGTFYIGNVGLITSDATAQTNTVKWTSLDAAQQYDSRTTEISGSYTEADVPSEETILDTFFAPGGGNGPNWKSSNNWWNGWHTSGGVWSSTGTLNGKYVGLDSGSQLRTNAFRLGPAQGTALPADAQLRVTFTPSATDSGASVLGTAIGDDESFYWNDGPFTAAQIEEGGTFGWNSDDDITIEIFMVGVPDADDSETITGTTDASSGTGGSRDNDPVSTPVITGLDSVTIRGNNNSSPRLFFVFDTEANRDSFTEEYADGSSIELSIGSNSYVASSIDWNNFTSGGDFYALIDGDEFETFPDTVPTGTSYSIEILATLGTLLASGCTAKTSVGGVECSVEDGTVYGISGMETLEKMQFRDVSQDGKWTNDGYGLLWYFLNQTDILQTEAILPTQGTLSVYYAGTDEFIFSYSYAGWDNFTGTVEQLMMTTGFTGVVPPNKTIVDVYYT